MAENKRWKGEIAHLLLAVMIFASPLVQGGTPRLGTVINEILFAFLLLAFVAGRSAKSHSTVTPGWVEISLYIFLLLSAFNLLRVPYYHDAERCFLLIVMYVGTFSIILRLPGDRPLAPALLSIKLAALFQAFLALWETFAIGSYQPHGTFTNPNLLAGFMVNGAALFMVDVLNLNKPAQHREELPDKIRFFPALGLAVLLAAILSTRSRGGTLALVVVLACLLVYRFRTRALVPLGLFITGLIIFPNPIRQRIMNIAVYDVYAYSRIDIWRSSIRMFSTHPVLGVGLGQYRFFSPRYAFPVENHWAHFAKMAENPHSEYLMLAAELGVVGLAVLFLFVAALFISLAKIRRSRQGLLVYPLWPLMIIIGVFVHAAADFNLHSPPIVLSSLVILAAFLIQQRETGSAIGGIRVHGKLIRTLALLFLPVYLVLIIRPDLGFYYFLKAGGGPVNLLDEKASLSGWGNGGRQPDYDHLNRAIFWDGDCAPYHSAMGSLAVKRYTATGDSNWLDLALVEIDTAMKLNPNNHHYYEHLADLQLSLYRGGELGQEGLSKSMENRRKSLSLSPSDVFIRERLARLEMEYGDINSAMGNFKIAVRKEPCFLRANFELGLALEKMGMIEDARTQYLKTVDSASQCRQNSINSQYESSLIDMDMSLVHNRLESLAK